MSKTPKYIIKDFQIQTLQREKYFFRKNKKNPYI